VPIGKDDSVGFGLDLNGRHRFIVAQPIQAESLPCRQQALPLQSAHVQRLVIGGGVFRPVLPMPPATSTAHYFFRSRILPKSSGKFSPQLAPKLAGRPDIAALSAIWLAP
jgi:hypothetical protein